MAIFQHEDYRQALRERADERRRLVPDFTYQSLAADCRVQKAYLSRALKGEAELSQDQLFLACKALGIEGLEREYLETLHAFGRSGIPERRAALAAALNRLRNQAQETRRHLATGALDSADAAKFAVYFLDPDLQLMHLMLTVDRLRKNPRQAGTLLGMTAERTTQALEILRSLGLIEIGRQGAVKVTMDALHLPAGAAEYRPYRQLVRQRSLARIQALGKDEGYCFSVFFSATRQTERRIRDGFLKLLKEIEADVRGAPAEEVYQLSFDLVPWT